MEEGPVFSLGWSGTRSLYFSSRSCRWQTWRFMGGRETRSTNHVCFWRSTEGSEYTRSLSSIVSTREGGRWGGVGVWNPGRTPVTLTEGRHLLLRVRCVPVPCDLPCVPDVLLYTCQHVLRVWFKGPATPWSALSRPHGSKSFTTSCRARDKNTGNLQRLLLVTIPWVVFEFDEVEYTSNLMSILFLSKNGISVLWKEVGGYFLKKPGGVTENRAWESLPPNVTTVRQCLVEILCLNTTGRTVVPVNGFLGRLTPQRGTGVPESVPGD